ncbi:MAG: AAA family ATPase [Deltaproteobacteria bacterium]|nr:AAA family ATPase [Deltaproteobacteria bacterium]
MPLASTHRFLFGDTTHSIGKRIWVVHGGHLQDWYYHNLLHGCLDIRRTIELWAFENGIQLTVTLTQDGTLDFSGNPDPQAAEALFEGSRPRRRGKYSSRPKDLTASLSGATANQEDEAAAQRARDTANRAQDAAGGAGQALLNTLGKLTHLIKSRQVSNLIILDNFDAIIEGLEIDFARNSAVLLSIKNIVQNDWHKNIAHHNFLIFLGTDKMRIEGLLPPKTYPKVMWREPGRPKPAEIEAALTRIAVRHGVTIHGCKPIAAILANQESTLELALWKVIGLIRQGEREITAGKILDLPPVNEQKLQEIKQELNELVGLDDLKKKVERIEEHAKEVRKNLLEGKGLPPDDSMHLVFAGSPGTGKTTAARIVANIFNAVGLLKKSEHKEVKFGDISSSNRGESGEKMKKIIEDALGGVLFIDEAHQLGKDSMGANEMVPEIVPAAENYRRELVFILAGYADQMHTFYSKDPGLPRRFPERGRIRFPDYTQEQLWQIFLINLGKNDFTLDASAEQRAKALLKKRSSQPNFGNAGGVRDLVAEIIERHNSGEQREVKVISVNDLPPLIKRDQKVLDEAMAALNGKVGIQPFRDKIQQIMNRINHALKEEEAGRGRGSINPRPPNMRFVGPPGTGKTTMAKLISKILYGIGSVNTNFLELSSANLKGRHVGDSENNFIEAIVKARGGVIFIDEAYSLTGDSFDKSIVDAIVAEIDKEENASTVFIIAGYKDKIDEFIRINSGLNRRFPLTGEIHFPNFTPKDCAELVRRELEQENYPYEDGLLDLVSEIASIAIREQQEIFGNAGWVKGDLLESIMDRMTSRVESSSLSLDDPDRRKILLVDLPEIESERPTMSETEERDATLYNWSPSPDCCHLPTRQPTIVVNTEQDVVSMIESAAFQIITKEKDGHGSATGFFVTADGVMATCAHVVRDASSMKVYCGRERQARGAKVLMIREELDLALILVDIEPPVPFLVLGNSLTLPALAPLVVFGNAHVNPHEPGRLITARVVRNDVNNPRALESDGAIEKGFSGGPAVNANTGEVVGIISSGYGVSATEQIRSEQLQFLLGNLGYNFIDNQLNQE